jgi:hypothetical protein
MLLEVRINSLAYRTFSTHHDDERVTGFAVRRFKFPDTRA